MAKGKFHETGEFAVGERPCSTRVRGPVSRCSDTICGPVAGVGRFGKLFCAVDVVIGPVGGDRGDCFVDGGPWFQTSSGGILGVSGRWEGWKDLPRARNVG